MIVKPKKVGEMIQKVSDDIFSQAMVLAEEKELMNKRVTRKLAEKIVVFILDKAEKELNKKKVNKLFEL